MVELPEPVSAVAASRKQSSKKPRKVRVRKPRYGVPPPLTFDITLVPRSHLLSLVEAAAGVRRTPQTCRLWTSQPDPPIKFFKSRDGRWMTTVGDVLDYLDRPRQCSRSKR